MYALHSSARTVSNRSRYSLAHGLEHAGRTPFSIVKRMLRCKRTAITISPFSVGVNLDKTFSFGVGRIKLWRSDWVLKPERSRKSWFDEVRYGNFNYSFASPHSPRCHENTERVKVIIQVADSMLGF